MTGVAAENPNRLNGSPKWLGDANNSQSDEHLASRSGNHCVIVQTINLETPSWSGSCHFLCEKKLWFQQDGATCHTARATIDLLKDTFGDRLISRFGPVNWPPRSCDLTPLDYFLWGYLKSLVYEDEPQMLDHLEYNIRRVIADICGHKCWKKSSKIGRPDWTTCEPAMAVLCQKSYLKRNATRLSFE
ncbi:DUF4817 domain-containing protein [Trichonephila clavipes]|uniref:DUF4817 domain-containing protein n=1 Tax=Trichonephila clavipes TaxID=2585209 RepID=A0A8X6S1F9_TRICX|nr:DUF4817 domain-containing protein [Trichonephila clavipes]